MSLSVPNFRLYFAGQSISMVGTWMQSVAQSWLVLQLSGSGTILGLVVAAQFLPVLLAGPYGGLVAGRANKRRLLLVTQSMLANLALVLGLLTVVHLVRLWMMVVFAVLFGVVNAVDNPTRQTFVPEVVGAELLRNAVSLTSAMTNAARAIGPAVAGILIAAVGVGVCFLANAASFVAVLLALALMRTETLQQVSPVMRQAGQLREGLRYIRSQPGLWVPLMMMALVGTLAYEFPVVLPLLAQTGMGGDARTYGFLTSAMGCGAILGGLGIAVGGRAGVIPLLVAACGFGAALLTAAVVGPLPAELTALGFVGVGSTAFLATGNTTLQLVTEPHFRGRVMALWSVTFLGSTPVGGPIIGIVAEHLGPRAGLAVGGEACLAAAILGIPALRRIPPDERVLREQIIASSLRPHPVTESDRA